MKLDIIPNVDPKPPAQIPPEDYEWDDEDYD